MGKRPVARDYFTRSSGQPCADSSRPRPGPPRRKRSVASKRDEIDGRNKSRDRRDGNTNLEDVSSDNILTQDAGYDADVEVVRPYAIEEPEDDADQTSTSVPTQPTTPKLLDATEYWQKELVSSLRGLYCDSDSNDTHPLSRQKRGRKRKTDTSIGSSQNIHAMPDMRDHDIDIKAEGAFTRPPKRLRRKSTKTGEDVKMAYSPASSGRDLSTGPTSAVLSPNTHESVTQDNSPCSMAIDQMDLD